MLNGFDLKILSFDRIYRINEIFIIVLILIPNRSRTAIYKPPLPDNKAETYKFQTSAVNSTSALLFPIFPWS